MNLLDNWPLCFTAPSNTDFFSSTHSRRFIILITQLLHSFDILGHKLPICANYYGQHFGSWLVLNLGISLQRWLKHRFSRSTSRLRKRGSRYKIFNDAYEVVSIVGFDGNSTVWLSRNIHRYVSNKTNLLVDDIEVSWNIFKAIYSILKVSSTEYINRTDQAHHDSRLSRHIAAARLGQKRYAKFLAFIVTTALTFLPWKLLSRQMAKEVDKAKEQLDKAEKELKQTSSLSKVHLTDFLQLNVVLMNLWCMYVGCQSLVACSSFALARHIAFHCKHVFLDIFPIVDTMARFCVIMIIATWPCLWVMFLNIFLIHVTILTLCLGLGPNGRSVKDSGYER